MTYNFCTYFDRNYLTRGLILYRSLMKHMPSFRLWILCLDDDTYRILNKLSLKNATLIKLEEFEDRELRRVKPTRSTVEYYWTLTPSLPRFVLRNNSRLPHIAYIDADLYFYSDPKPIYDEWKNDSILIVPHNFPSYLLYKEHDSGKFNVSFVLFRNDNNGRACIEWWREKCIEWCYLRYDNGRLGDQLYLNSWPKLFKGVHALRHKGGGLAPWNLTRYQLCSAGEKLLVDGEPLIFFHFHGFRMFPNAGYEAARWYEIPHEHRMLIYELYYSRLQEAEKEVRAVAPGFHYGYSERPSLTTNFINRLYVTKLAVQRSLLKTGKT